jgi:cell division septum initiation protein DivIVA
MSASPADPEFDPTRPPLGEAQTGNGSALGHTSRESATVESTSTEIGAISGAIEELQTRLARAHSQLEQVTAVQTTEIEIGRLFVEAQRFSEDFLSRLETQIGQILVEAEAKAADIVREATEEALEIRRRIHGSSVIPARTAQDLQSVIGSFASINGELIKQLNALSAMVMAAGDRGASSTDPWSPAMDPN